MGLGPVLQSDVHAILVPKPQKQTLVLHFTQQYRAHFHSQATAGLKSNVTGGMMTESMVPVPMASGANNGVANAAAAPAAASAPSAASPDSTDSELALRNAVPAAVPATAIAKSNASAASASPPDSEPALRNGKRQQSLIDRGYSAFASVVSVDGYLAGLSDHDLLRLASIDKLRMAFSKDRMHPDTR